MENLIIVSNTFLSKVSTYSENIFPHNPAPNTTSIVPYFILVKTYKSLANIIPGRKLVKKT